MTWLLGYVERVGEPAVTPALFRTIKGGPTHVGEFLQVLSALPVGKVDPTGVGWRWHHLDSDGLLWSIPRGLVPRSWGTVNMYLARSLYKGGPTQVGNVASFDCHTLCGWLIPRKWEDLMRRAFCVGFIWLIPRRWGVHHGSLADGLHPWLIPQGWGKFRGYSLRHGLHRWIPRGWGNAKTSGGLNY